MLNILIITDYKLKKLNILMPKTNYIKLFVCFNFYGKIMGGQTFNKFYKTGDKAWIEK